MQTNFITHKQGLSSASLVELLLDLLFPRICIFCGHKGSYCCSSCARARLDLCPLQLCHVCRHPVFARGVHRECTANTDLDGVWVCFYYNETVAKLVFLAKYQFYSDVCLDLADKMSLLTPADFAAGALITWVPAHWRRVWWRGFNQAEVLARRFARLRGREAQPLLRRSRHTHSQVGQGRAQRLQNLRQAFELHPAWRERIVGQSVLLIDDVMTTGATLEQCAQVLKAAGASEVAALVLARGAGAPLEI